MKNVSKIRRPSESKTYCAWIALSMVCFASKRRKSWIILTTTLGLAFGNKETLTPTGTHGGHHSSEKRHITTRVMQYSFNVMWIYAKSYNLSYNSGCERF
jgi:hypothetical protein